MSGKKSLQKDKSKKASKPLDLFSIGILNSLSSHICVVNADGEIIAINRAWTKFGYENGGDPQGLSEGSNYFAACQKAIDSDGHQAAAKAVEGIKKVLADQLDLFEMEYDCHSPDENRWFLMRVSPMHFRGNKAVISHIDITEKKLAEVELEALHTIDQYIGESGLDRVTERILEQVSFVVKPDLCLVFLRQGDKLRLQGICPKAMTPVIDEHQFHRVGHCLCGISVSSGEPIFSSNISLDDRCTFAECKAAGITSFAALPLISKGQVIGTIGLASYQPRDFSQNRRFLDSVAIDIAMILENSLLIEQISNNAADLERQLATRKELEAQIVQMQKMDAIGTLAGGIAHDFNNLLAIIKGNIDLLQVKQPTPTALTEKLTNINKAVTRATDLVQQILSFSRQKSLKSEPIDLNFAVNEDMKFLRSTIPTTVEILKQLASEPVIINADNTQLQQVLINLCNNAVHAMGNKGLLTISLEQSTFTADQLPANANISPGHFAKLSVSDSGSGMDKQTREKIFDPFFTTKDLGAGTGLGLSVVHGIVRAHGGFIAVDSEPGHGSTFHLYFPLYAEADHQSEIKQYESLPHGKERILFVDDEEYLVNLGQEMLEHLGYKVTSSTSSSQALEWFKNQPQAFDLVITDQTMPEFSGVELAKEMLSIRPDIPIILCSGYSSTVSEETLKEQGIYQFCMKPLSMDQIARVTREALTGKKIKASRPE